MSFLEIQFPVGVSMGAIGGPGFKTTIVTLASGAEQRNIDWQYARGVWEVSQVLKTQDELDVLANFFYVARGRAYGFRFKDWSDFQLPSPDTDTPVQFTTDGTTSTFQINKFYPNTAGSYTRPIFKPVDGTVQVLKDGVQIFSPGDWTVDTTTGIVTLSSAITETTGSQIAVSCQFDVPVRFDVDQMKTKIEEYNNFTWGPFTLVELPPQEFLG